jgi:uncharacterized membrane protein YgcG
LHWQPLPNPRRRPRPRAPLPPGLATLTRLQWLSLGWFESARLEAISRITGLRALQLRSLSRAPRAARLAEVAAPMVRLRYLALEGMRLDGAGGGGGGAAGPGGNSMASAGGGGGFLADALDITLYGGWAGPVFWVCMHAERGGFFLGQFGGLEARES